MVPESPKFFPEQGVDHDSSTRRRPSQVEADSIPAQKVAQAVHVSGYQVAKTVLFEAEGERWMAVLPAMSMVDTDRLGEILDKRHVRLLDEEEFVELFPECEVGAEPPFGSLFGIPVLMDDSLREEECMLVRGGSHDEALELRTDDFERLERPWTGTFAVMPETQHYVAEPEIPAPM
jgi:Ala-tRNA(Pro) deacylase